MPPKKYQVPTRVPEKRIKKTFFDKKKALSAMFLLIPQTASASAGISTLSRILRRRLLKLHRASPSASLDKNLNILFSCYIVYMTVAFFSRANYHKSIPHPIQTVHVFLLLQPHPTELFLDSIINLTNFVAN
jgi:hypothetical protein